MAGDREELERMVRAHHDAVRAYLVRRASAEDAADALSETFLVAWRRIDERPDETMWLPWLYGIARRTLANQRRAQQRQGALIERLHGLGAIAGDQSPDTGLMTALAALGPADREALMLVAWEGLSTEDAAHVLGCRASTFRMRLVRARRRLAVLLDDPPETPRTQSPVEHRS
ncbi:RNA polymerase sigma factor [Paraconexibacter sp. AEG42_29]|uniref:RNA polymerase sigma factor n=1 Tax=Paraconexibacter sp. AEG42_29 TaxID=2997339 RepID=UPI00339D470C